MIRVLTILTTIAALAVTAAPASAATSKKPPPQTLKNAMVTTFGVKARSVGSFFLDIGTTETLDLNSAPPKPPPQGAIDPITGADLSGKKAKPNARSNGNGFTHTLEDAIIVSLKR